jgi:peptidoglycan hydrolase-like protein with peptidoglycan-binding domain
VHPGLLYRRPVLAVRRAFTILLSATVLAVVAGVAYWAGTNAVVPPALTLPSHDPVTYTVQNGKVGSSVTISVTAAWTTTRTLQTRSGGTVTGVPLEPGAEAAQGAVIATLDLRPVVVATGTVPMFRTLARGIDGPDVAQLQQFLKAKGFYTGGLDGRFRSSTTSAVKRWQGSIGAAETGVVDEGDLVFVETLPARMEVIPVVGQRLAPGSDLVRVLAPKPVFVASVGSGQMGSLRTSQAIALAAPNGGVWSGTLGTFVAQTDGRGGYDSAISGTLCGTDCGLVPVTGETEMQGTVEIVPETKGPVVPTSALTVQPSGAAAVTMADGSVRDVTIIAEADGFVVVSGIEAGAVIRLPGQPQS